jgi:hypothetical protein
MLKEIPTDDPVYQRHSQKLYALRFNDLFTQFRLFAQDQQNTVYDTQIHNIAIAMKTDLNNEALSLPGNPTDPNW